MIIIIISNLMRYERRRRTLKCRETALVNKGGMDQVINTVLNFK